MNNQTETSDQQPSLNAASVTQAGTAHKGKPATKPGGFRWKKWLLMATVAAAIMASHSSCSHAAGNGLARWISD